MSMEIWTPGPHGMLCPDARAIRTFADGRPAHRGCADGTVQLAARPRPAAGSSCSGSRTPTASARRPENVEQIFDALRWLELDWDEEPVFQSERGERHAEVVQKLIDDGRAYRSTPGRDEIKAWHEQHGNRGFRGEDEGEGAVRLRVADEGATVVRDVIRGESGVRERAPGRPRDRARRRHAALPPRGRGRRPRHGHHPRRPRRRPLLQHPEADADPRRRWGRSRRSTRTSRCSTGPTARSSPSATAPPLCRNCASAATSRRRCATTSRCWAGATRSPRSSSPPSELEREFSLERVSKSPAVFDEQKLRHINGRYLRELGLDDLTRGSRR